MTVYRYKATNYKGDIVSGTIEAETEELVIESIQSQNLIPVKIAKKSGFEFSRSDKKISEKIITAFTLQLSTLLGAGLPLDRSLYILADMEDNPQWRVVLDKLLERVKAGSSLSDAMQSQDNIFSRFYISLISAGEVPGSLNIILERLAEHQERSSEMKSAVTKALIYPAILVISGFLIVLYLLLVTVPKFEPIIAKNKTDLPFISDVIFGMSAVLRHYWYIVIATVVLFVLYLKYWFTSPKNKANRDKKVLNMPKFGDIVRKSELAKSSRTLGTMLTHGVPLVIALNSVKETVSNSILGDVFENAVNSLKSGRGMAKILIESKQFPSLGVQMIKVGEETGKLEAMLLKVADIYEKEVKNSVDSLVALVGPIAILIIAAVVALIMVGVILAILSLNA